MSVKLIELLRLRWSQLSQKWNFKNKNLRLVIIVFQSLSHVWPTLCDALAYSTTGIFCPPLSPGVCSNSCPLSRWCHPTISSSVVPFSSCPQSFPASGSFPMSRLFASGGQSIRSSASASVLPMNIRDWSPLGLMGLISLQSKVKKGNFGKLRHCLRDRTLFVDHGNLDLVLGKLLRSPHSGKDWHELY